MQNENTASGKGGKYGRLLQNTAIFSVGTFASKLLVFLLLPFYTNYLSASEYSTADLIANMANFLIPIFCCGVSEGVLRFSLFQKKGNNYPRESIFSVSVVITCLGSLVLLLLIPLLGFFTELGSYGLLVGLYVIAANFHSIVSEYVRACERSALYAWQGVLNTVLVIVLNLTFLIGFHAGVTGYVLSVVLANFLTTVFLVLYARLYRVFSLKHIRGGAAKALVAFSLPFVPASLLWWVVSVSDRYILSWISGAEINGLYVVAAKIPTLVTLLCTVFLSAWKISAVVEDEGMDEEAVKAKSEFYSRVYKGFIAVLFCMGAGIVLFSKLFAVILFADSYYESWRYIPILTLGTVFYSLSRFLGSIYFANLQSMRSFLTTLAAALLNVVLNLILIPHYGAYGAAAATFAAYLLEYVIRDIDTQKQISFLSHRRRVTLCALILLAETMVVTLDFAYSLWIAVGLTVLMIAVSGTALLEMVRGFFGLLRNRLKKSGSS